jgi:hypothetical protein
LNFFASSSDENDPSYLDNISDEIAGEIWKVFKNRPPDEAKSGLKYIFEKKKRSRRKSDSNKIRTERVGLVMNFKDQAAYSETSRT